MYKRKIIAIIGLMAVGKTTIGAKLAEKLHYYFVDCDAEIEDLQRKTIKEIFVEKGEKYFRQIEEEAINDIILRDEEMVLSLGGGAFMNEKTRKILQEKAITIWFYTSIDEILKRIGNKDNRPLLNKKNKREILEELINIRYPIYAKADLKFDTGEINHELLIKKIIQEIKLLENAK